MFEALKQLRAADQTRSIADLFAGNPDRADQFSASLGDQHFDYSKTHIDAAVMQALTALCEQADLAGRRAAMFSGEKINETEGRAVLHTALRRQEEAPVLVDGVDVMPDVRATLARMREYADAVRSGRLTGAGGAITDVVNIGIGGSCRCRERPARAHRVKSCWARPRYRPRESAGSAPSSMAHQILPLES